jgi:hypothetical protein
MDCWSNRFARRKAQALCLLITEMQLGLTELIGNFIFSPLVVIIIESISASLVVQRTFDTLYQMH